jgi:hypothetical protein
MDTKKQLVLNKGSEKYIFRYPGGSEGQLLDALVLCGYRPADKF